MSVVRGPLVDDTDLAIIDALILDSRATYGEIGTLVSLSAPAVKRRMDRLAEQGVIVRYTAEVDHRLLGRPIEAFTELTFSGNTRVDVIAAIANDVPEVERVFTMAGEPDALVWLRVRDVQHLRLVIDRLRRDQHVAGTKTMIVLDSSAHRTGLGLRSQ